MTLISRLMLNLKSLDERRGRRQTKSSTTFAVASRAERPEFTTHVSRYATWVQTHVVDAFALRTLTDSTRSRGTAGTDTTGTAASSLDIGHYYMDSEDEDADDEESLEDDEIELRSVSGSDAGHGLGLGHDRDREVKRTPALQSRAAGAEAWGRRYSDCESYKSYETVYGFAY